MQVALWIGTIAVFSLAQTGLIMAWVMTGAGLRLAQEEVTGTKLFAYVRVLGVRKFLVWTTARGFRKRVRERCRQDWGPLIASAGLLLLAASMPAVVSLLSLFFMSPFLLPGGDTVGLSALTVITAVALGIIPQAWFWTAGLDYAARAGTRGRSGLPCLKVPGLSRAARDDLALRIYWYEGLKWRAVWAIASTWILLAAATVGARVPQTSEPGDGLAVLVLLAGQGLPVVVVNTVYRRLAFDHVLSGICFLLAPASVAKTVRAHQQGAFDGPIADPFRQRDHLAKLAGALSSAAWALDARQVRGTAPHPVSTLLRAASERLRRFLRSKESWSASLPPRYTELLHSVVRLLSMPSHPGAYTDLVDRVPAFNRDGQPAADPGPRPPGRLATIASRVTTGIQGVVSAVTGIVTIAIIVIVWTLFMLHRLDILNAVSRTP
ncbi:hypothetical protein EAS64_38500 [Trebonia kvetii]|uniref:Uncharacterized protein n=1 Tax=Trebonia kvetii TaxID=2480626 RepID=A0A6P2BRS9_9ACTN|nr:hypothetical protein [Trebonia kvetii]TVY99982.1 hypothetical protein EAS64_38500 [Trebonia kvetii]